MVRQKIYGFIILILNEGVILMNHEPHHLHQDEYGIWHKCYHACRHRWYIWLPIAFVAQSLLVPFEHQIAEWAWTNTPFLDSLFEKFEHE